MKTQIPFPHFLAGLAALGSLLVLTTGLALAKPAASPQLEAGPVEAAVPTLFGSELAPNACTPDTPNMVSYWPLDDLSGEQTADVIGGRNATCSGAGCPDDGAGGIGGFLNFVSDKVNVTDSAAFNWTNADSFSIELWVKPAKNCTDTGRQVYVGKYRGTTGTYTSWWVGCENNDRAAFNLRDSAGQSLTINGGDPLSDGQSHHIVAVRDGAQNRNLLYVDGALKTSQIQTYSGDFSSDQELNIGYYNVAPFYPYSGHMDEVAIYGRALAAAEVQRHYNGGGGQTYCNDAPVADDESLVAIKGTPLNFDSSVLLTGDMDPDGDTLTITSIDQTGLSGTITVGVIEPLYTYTPPTAVYMGTTNFKYTISDGGGLTDTATVTITVRESNAAPSVNNPGNQGNDEGDAVDLQIQATDPDNDPLIKYEATGLPDGLTLDPQTGLISGTIGHTASTGSPYTVTIKVWDAGILESLPVSFQWTVTDKDAAPVLAQPSNQFKVEGDMIHMQLEASDPDNDPLTFGATGLPPGLTLNPSTGLISGMLASTSAGQHTTMVTVSDGTTTVTAQFTWDIADHNPKFFLPLVVKPQ